MEFAGFDWNGGDRKKCQKHGISIAEIESVFSRPVGLLPDRDNPQGERRFRAIGSTSKGRRRGSWYLPCATTVRASSAPH